MKPYTILFFLAVPLFTAALSASEIAETFETLLPKFDSRNLGEREDRQRKWQQICLEAGCNAEVTALMCRELEKEETPAATVVFFIRQLGYAGDASAERTLRKFESHADRQIREEAVRALATIAGEKRENAAKIPPESAMPMAIPYTDDARVADYVRNFDSMNDAEKIRVLANLTVRGDKKYLPLAYKAVESDEKLLRQTGIATLAALGGVPEAKFLFEMTCRGGDFHEFLLGTILPRMPGREIDETLLEEIRAADDFSRVDVAGNILGMRFNAEMVPIILRRSQEPEARRQLFGLHIAADRMARKEHVPGFVRMWECAEPGQLRDRIETTVARISEDDASAALTCRTDENYAAFFSMLGRIGDERTLGEIRAAVFDGRRKDATVSETLRGLCNWPNGLASGDLLRVAEDHGFSESDRTAALRAFIRIISLPQEKIKIDIDDAEKISLLRKAMNLVNREDERRLIVERAGKIRQVASLDFVLPYVDDPQLRDEACRAVLELAHHAYLRRSDKSKFLAALEKVLSVTGNNEFIDRAKHYRNDLEAN